MESQGEKVTDQGAPESEDAPPEGTSGETSSAGPSAETELAEATRRTEPAAGDVPEASANESAEGAASGAEDDDSLGTRFELEVLGPCRRRLKASVAADRVAEELDRSYRELAQSVALPGFRRGRVPRRLLERRFGDEITQDVKENLLGQSFSEVVEKEAVRVFGAPSFDNVVLERDKDFTYEAELEIYPEFDLPTYKGLEVDGEEVSVDEKEIDDELEDLRRRRAETAPRDLGEATEEDFLIASAQVYRLNVPETSPEETETSPEDAEASPEDAEAGGAGQGGDGSSGEKRSDRIRVKGPEQVTFSPAQKRVAGFEVEDLVEKFQAWKASWLEASQGGVRPQEVPWTDVVTAPASYPDELLRGERLELELQVEDCMQLVPPDLDDAFAKEFGVESLEELRGDIRDSVERRRRREADRRVERKIIDTLLEHVAIEVPEHLVERRRQAAASEEDHAREHAALAGEAGDATGGPSEAADGAAPGEAGELAAAETRRELKEFFLLEKIASEEKIVVTERELNMRCNTMAALYDLPADRLRAELEESGRIDEMRVAIREEKVRAFLRKRANVRMAEVDGAGDSARQESGPRVEEGTAERSDAGNASPPPPNGAEGKEQE